MNKIFFLIVVYVKARKQKPLNKSKEKFNDLAKNYQNKESSRELELVQKHKKLPAKDKI